MALWPVGPRYSVFIAQSLDGFIAGPGHEMEWLSLVDQEGEDYGFNDFFNSVDGLVMGRATYDFVISAGATMALWK